MAIQVNGTTVIDNSRNITNVGSVTATSFSGDGSNLTNIPSGAASSVVSYASAPAVPSIGGMYYNTTDNILYVSNGTGWLEAIPQGPESQGGTIAVDIPYQAGGTAYSLDLRTVFEDAVTPDNQLVFAFVGAAPPGMSISNSYYLVHDNATWSPNTSGSAYDFSISATDSDGITGTPQAFSLLLGGRQLKIQQSELPDWNNPQLNLTTSGTINLPSGLNENTVCYVYLVGTGGPGNDTLYQGGWYFGGLGGDARIIICKASILDGSLLTIPAPDPVPTGSWQPGSSRATTLLIQDRNYSTAHGSNSQVIIDQPPPTLEWLSDGLIANYFQIAATSPGLNPPITIIEGTNEVNFGKGLASSNTAVGSYEQYIFAAGKGWAEYSGTGYGTSLYAGDGGSGRYSAGVAPGGGGGYQAIGAAGSCRIYYAT